MVSNTVNRIYGYEDYRHFLREFFTEKKSLAKTFSHRAFALRAGFNSPSFMLLVMDGKRNLSRESTAKIVKAIGLSGRALEYFETLVIYNQSDKEAEREELRVALERLRRQSSFYRVNDEQFAFYRHWYYPVVRELAIDPKWDGSFSQLGESVMPPISEDDAREAVDTLCSIGMLRKNTDGTYSREEPAVTAADVPSAVTRPVRRQYIRLAERAMDSLPMDQRHISALTVMMSEEGYSKICEKIDELRQAILAEAVDEEKAAKVFQLNLQLYPLSRDIVRSQRHRSR